MVNVNVFDWDAADNNTLTSELRNIVGGTWKVVGMTDEDRKSIILKIRLVLSLFFKRNIMDEIVFWQQSHGLMYANLLELLRVKKVNRITIMTLIYKESKGFRGKIKYNFFKRALQSKHVNTIICYSANECELYSNIFEVPIEKFAHTMLGVHDFKQDISKYSSDKGYLLAAGNSNRDYKFLTEALNGTNYKCYIIDRTCELSDTDNCKIVRNVNYGEQLYSFIENSQAIIIPLVDENISSGQTVIIQAFMFGKPVIATYSKAIDEYITDGVNGYIISKNKQDLLNKIEDFYSDEKKYESMSKAARKQYEDNFSYEAFSKNVANIIAARKKTY
ncbi:Glycosyltransferase involved in cell wall bisynthesis [Butyrivibrio sp. ob235]|uniref:glycosyltransferase n=1 Tax=Butyrivibrio sp. ob235 TaxID=1761780 RepID=UPI0008BB7545|nr:glycosyltransferase [Butyrivibrio sp. ob235]SEL72752.1 Glycosyltransferase involved in cell wall bisynthesis [Butyrivibrio sp. ob235]